MVNKKLKLQHENFEANDLEVRQRLKVVRQDRKNVEDLDCYLEIGSTKHKITNISSFGILVRSTTKFDPSTFEGTLTLNNIELGTLRLKLIRNQQQDNEDAIYAAFEVVGEPISIERIIAIEDSIKIISMNESYQSSTKRIPDTFARKVYEIKDWLESLQSGINSLESDLDKNEINSKITYEQTIIQVMGDYFNSIMPIKNNDLSGLIRDFNSEVIKNCYEFFRDKLKALIYQAPFSNRVYSKPLGYAGDYEMMNIIYRSEPEGASLFAKCLHQYWVQQPAAQAVRNRADYIVGKIKENIKNRDSKSISVLSVACGPAKEWQNILRDNELVGCKFFVELLDQDEEALKHAQRKIKEQQLSSSVEAEFEYTKKAIKNILVRGLEKKYDLIYSAGLFDYFSDPVAQLAALKLYDALNPGGKLIIGNFNVSNPNSLVMDLALDWHLIYRSEDDMHKLFERTGGEIQVETEKLNINLFCVITKDYANK